MLDIDKEIVKMKKEISKLRKDFDIIKKERDELRAKNEILTVQSTAYENNKIKRKWLNGYYNE